MENSINNDTCSIDDCGRQLHRKHLCATHYRRQLIGVAVLEIKPHTLPLEIRFWSKVNKTDNCWLWLAGKDKDGYGLIRNNQGVHERAHRLSWTMHRGAIPNGMQICHECDNPPCVNPDHLFLGTHQDNVDDKVNKLRQPKHENHGQAVLTDNNVLDIRKNYFNKALRPFELAEQHNVSHSCIMDIIKFRSWKDL
jgi:hypothetical protein